MNQLKSCRHLCISDRLNDFHQSQLDLKSFPVNSNICYFCNCLALQLKTESKNEIADRLNERCHDVYSGGQEVGTTILIDSVELIDLISYDLFSQTIAPFKYFFISRRQNLKCDPAKI